MDDREVAARPPKTIMTDVCLYDAPTATLYGYLYDIDPEIGVTYPEWVAIESHITGARYVLGIDMTQLIDACDIHNGVIYVFKHGDTHPSFKRFRLYKTREKMIAVFREVIKG